MSVKQFLANLNFKGLAAGICLSLIAILSISLVQAEALNFDADAPVGPAGYQFAATNNSIIEVNGAMNIAYGSQGQFVYKLNQIENLHCHHEVFGLPTATQKTEDTFCFTAPVIGDDLSCSVSHDNLADAQILFGEHCANFQRLDCEQVAVNENTLWLCSSDLITNDKAHPTRYGLPDADGKIFFEAEDYARAKDLSAENIGGAYRAGRVDLEKTKDVIGGFQVGWLQAGESLSYDFYNSTAEAKTLELRVAAPLDVALFSLTIDDEIILGNQSLDYTVADDKFATQSFSLPEIGVGHHQLTVHIENGPFNFNWLRLSPVPPAVNQPVEQDLASTDTSTSEESANSDDANTAEPGATTQLQPEGEAPVEDTAVVPTNELNETKKPVTNAPEPAIKPDGTFVPSQTARPTHKVNPKDVEQAGALPWFCLILLPLLLRRRFK